MKTSSRLRISKNKDEQDLKFGILLCICITSFSTIFKNLMLTSCILQLSN